MRIVHAGTQIVTTLAIVDDDGDVVETREYRYTLPKPTETACLKLHQSIQQARADLQAQLPPTPPIEQT